MGSKDTTEKTLEAYDDVFADIANVFCFGGSQTISPGSLGDAQPFSLYKAGGDIRSQERDVSKFWHDRQIRICLFGLENQTEPDPNMVYRVLGYDAAAYRWQLAQEGATNCFPVVTLVLYFGTARRWTAPVTLRGRLNIPGRAGIPDSLDALVSDYRITVKELAWLEPQEAALFRSDFRAVVEYLRDKRLRRRYRGSDRRLVHAAELMDLFRAISGDQVFDDIKPAVMRMAERKEGGVTMCDVVQEIKKEGFSLGRAEGLSLGRQEGVSEVLSALSRLEAAGRPYSIARLADDAAYRARILGGGYE